MSYQVLVQVIGDEGTILALCLDNINEKQEAVDFAEQIADFSYNLTGISPFDVTDE